MEENTTIKERLISFIAYLGIGQGKFEKKCGLANAYVAHIRQSISPEKLQKIAQQYPELNTGWLMTGEGEMLKSPNHTIINSPIGDNSTQIAGSNVTENTSLNKALDELTEMRKLLAEAIRNNKEQADRFFRIIEKIQTP